MYACVLQYNSYMMFLQKDMERYVMTSAMVVTLLFILILASLVWISSHPLVVI